MKPILRSSIRARTGLAGSMALLFVALIPAPLHAQSIDYGALEQLFKEPVTTSVDGSPQRVSDVPATMEIITAEEIRRSGAKDIPGVLRHLGGIDTLEWGNDDIDVGVRGYDQAYSPRLLVLVDGRQVYADDFGHTPWSSVPVELGAIRQIEVIKGPNSALFGFNAIGGVINIVTYNPIYDKIDSVSATGGTQALRGGSIVATHQFGSSAAVRLSAGGNLDSDFSTLIPASEDVVMRREEYRDAIDIDSVIRVNSKMELGVEATQSASELTEMQPVYELGIDRYNIESLKGRLTAESGIGLIQAAVYTNWLKLTTIPGFAGEAFRFNNRVTVAQFDDTFKVGTRQIFRAAAEYRYNTELTTPTTGGSVHYNNFAASGMWNWKIAPSISLTNAIRIDHLMLGRDGYLPPNYPFVNSDWDRSFTEPSFGSGLVWKPTNTNSLRFLINRGVQLPSLNLSGAFLVDTPFLKITGSPLLNPSTMTNYEIGWDHVVAGPHLLFRASAFHQNTNGLSATGGGYLPTASGPFITSINVGRSAANGIELGFKGIFSQHYRWGANYRFEQISDHFVPAAQNAAAGVEYQHTTPAHLLKANLGWASDKWEVDGYLQYQSADDGLQATPTAAALTPVPAFVTLDGRIAYNPKKWTNWSVSGQNLTHASQIQTSGPAVERRVLGTLTFNF